MNVCNAVKRECKTQLARDCILYITQGTVQVTDGKCATICNSVLARRLSCSNLLKQGWPTSQRIRATFLTVLPPQVTS